MLALLNYPNFLLLTEHATSHFLQGRVPTTALQRAALFPRTEARSVPGQLGGSALGAAGSARLSPLPARPFLRAHLGCSAVASARSTDTCPPVRGPAHLDAPLLGRGGVARGRD